MEQTGSPKRARALDTLLPQLQQELRRLARHQMRDERAHHTLQPTALVNEAYVRLAEQHVVRFEDEGHFRRLAARAMRQILVDYARARHAAKRGGARTTIQLDEAMEVARPAGGVDLLRLDDALDALAKLDERQSRVVELRFFGGLSIPETAEALGVSRATVENDWRTAKLWLRRELRPDGGPDDA